MKSRIPVIPVPGWKSTSAAVRSWVGGVPARERAADSAIEKHVEWAAAMSSSGLVTPLGSSDRAGHETGNVPMPDEARVTAPPPSSREPFHSAVARRVVAMGCLPVVGVEW
jgi:hypothetical protein